MMKRTYVLGGAAAVGLATLGLCATGWAQKSKGKTQPAETKYLMRGVNQPNCAGAGKLLKDGPADDKAWDTLACQAAILNEMSYVLMSDGRCPDGTWAGAAKELRAGSAAVLEAAEQKNLEAARTSFKQVTASCGACHTAHKPKT